MRASNEDYHRCKNSWRNLSMVGHIAYALRNHYPLILELQRYTGINEILKKKQQKNL
jgi:hypothetical protein